MDVPARDAQASALAAGTALGARTLSLWLGTALAVAQDTRELIDSLNVFPVPDSDTGTNVSLTLTSATHALRMLPPGADLVLAARAAADGALRGARGNSGLLFSQALCALADTAAAAPHPTALRPVELVHAYEEIAHATWQAVSRPVTGTLLTVAEDAARAARDALEGASATAPASLADIAAAAALGAQESVVETAGLGHGPVDAGGAALMLLYTALPDVLTALAGTKAAPEMALTPSAISSQVLEAGAYTPVAITMLRDLAAGVTHTPRAGEGAAAAVEGASTGEFEVMYLLEATTAQARALREHLEAIGDCVGVVGTPDALGVGLYQVHVHTDTPRAALPTAGRARQICIHHLQPTAMALAGGWEVPEAPLPYLRETSQASNVVSFERLAARHAPAAATPVPAPAAPSLGVIATTRAPGLIEPLARTGAVVVLNPERDGLVRAAGDLGCPRLLVLPCDAAATTAAHEAARELAARAIPSVVAIPDGAPRPGGAAPAGRGSAGKDMAAVGGAASVQLVVADTDDEARVVAAAVAVAGHDPSDELAEVARRATLAGAAMRTVALEGVQAEPEVAASLAAAQMRADDALVTLIVGRHALPDVGVMVEAAVQARAEALTGGDEVEVVIHAGGQESPDVLIAFE